MPFMLTREQLYGLVWSEPMQRLGDKTNDAFPPSAPQEHSTAA